MESFAALDAALLPGPPDGCSPPLDQVERGSGSGCRALLYVTRRLLTQVARDSGPESRRHLLEVSKKPTV